MDVSCEAQCPVLVPRPAGRVCHIHGIKLTSSKEGGSEEWFVACPSFQAMPKSGLGTYWLVQTKSDLGPISTPGFLGCSDPIMSASTNLASNLTSGNLGQVLLCLQRSRNVQPPMEPPLGMPVSGTAQAGGSCLQADRVLPELGCGLSSGPDPSLTPKSGL